MAVFKTPHKNTWSVKLRYRDWQNKPVDTTKRGFRTKREALAWEADFLAKEAGNLDMNFAQFTKVYLDAMAPRMKLSTTETKTNIISTKLLPFFGEKKMNDITPSDVLKWQNTLLVAGKYTPVYLKTIHNQLSAIFNYAVRYYDLSKNPARIAGNMGSADPGEMKFWTQEEYTQFAYVMMDSPIAHVMFQLLYWCGLRSGEALALTLEDFSFKNGTVYINKTYMRLHGEDIVTPPKTPTSVRTVQLPQFLQEKLEEYFDHCYDLQPTDRVFPVTKDFLRQKMNTGSKQAGVQKIRIHDLRHSHVSLLINMGFHAVAIAQRVGHKSIDITYRYAHLFPSVQVDIAKQLDAQQEVF